MTSDQTAPTGQPRPGSVVIAAVKDEDSFRQALTSPGRDVWCLQFGNIRTLPRPYAASQADYLEIRPGRLSPKILDWVREMSKKPLLASGLIRAPEEARAAVSPSAYALWALSDGQGI